MSVQLFMQATILLANYYGYTTIRYADIQERSASAGFQIIPFMPPETVRATPELVNFFNVYTGDRNQLEGLLVKYGGYKVLVKYYIRTGLRASQSICRNYLLGLEERNAYLEFLQRELGVAATLASGILLLVNANNTLTQSFLLGITSTNSAIDAYQEFRFLNVDREAALTLVEAAQNKLAEHFMQLVDSASPESTSAKGGYTFSDALHAVSLIEQQCTRTGIRHLLTRSIANSPSNLDVDKDTGAFLFHSSQRATPRSLVREPRIPARDPLSAITTPPAPPPVVAVVPGIVAPARPRPVVIEPPVVTPPPVVVRVDPAVAAAEMDLFIQPGGPSSAFDASNREKLEGLLRGLTAPAQTPNLLSVLRSPNHLELRLRLYDRFKGR